MFSRLKKKSEATVPLVPAWHPDFRNFERLPDIKVVRTAFFTNGVSVVIASLVFFWFGYREYQLHDLNRQIDDWQRQIDRDRSASTVAIGQFKKFQGETARVAEVESFIKSRPLYSEVLLRLAETLPASVALDVLDFRDRLFTLRASVRGSPDLASGYASAYLQVLKSDSALAEQFGEISISSLTLNPQSGVMLLEIKMKLKDATKP